MSLGALPEGSEVRDASGVPTGELLEAIRDLADGDQPPGRKEMHKTGAYSPRSIMSRLGVDEWWRAVAAAGLYSRRQHVFAALARAEHSDKAWMTPKEIAKRWVPEWVPTRDVSFLLGQLDAGEHGLTAEPWNPDSKKGSWRVTVAESGGDGS